VCVGVCVVMVRCGVGRRKAAQCCACYRISSAAKSDKKADVRSDFAADVIISDKEGLKSYLWAPVSRGRRAPITRILDGRKRQDDSEPSRRPLRNVGALGDFEGVTLVYAFRRP
jgi:hypothetical protein